MTEDRLAQIMRSTADELLAQFEKARAIQHVSSRGATREGPVLAFVSGRLPGVVKAVGSAEVMDPSGTTSRAADILVLDNNIQPFFDDNKHSIYPAESVHGVIEVKSRLNRTELRDACENLASVKRLPKDCYLPDPLQLTYLKFGQPTTTFPTCGYIFAYDSATSLASIANNVIEWCQDNPDPHLWPNCVYILNKGVVTWFLKDNHDRKQRPEPGARIGVLNTLAPRDVLILMAIDLNGAFSIVRPRSIALSSYFGQSALGVTGWSEPAGPPWPAEYNSS